jgi:aminoglycoside phosphotransferase (APT) family kinase protein
LNYRVIGRPEGGESGVVWLVEDDEGRTLVMKVASGDIDRLQRSAERIERLRARGFPAPARVGIEQDGDRIITFQERLPGTPWPAVTHAVLDQLLAINEVQAGAAIGGETAFPDETGQSLITGELYGFDRTKATDHPLGAALLARVAAIGRAVEDVPRPIEDIVLGDYHGGNVLAEGDRITGIIDVDTCQDGDRRFDLVTLWFWLGLEQPHSEALDRLEAHVRQALEPELLAAYVAHLVLRNTGFFLDRGRIERFERMAPYMASMLDQLPAL